MAKQISIKDLSPEQLADLKAQALADEQERVQNVKKQRQQYKGLVNDNIPGLFKKLIDASMMLANTKKTIYDELKTLTEMKCEVYDREDDQSSHSFTSDDGLTIIIGHRINDGWDDTAAIGIKKVHDYLDTLGTDHKSKQLVKTILQLLSQDSKGTLKASRVLQLKKLADDIGDKEFIDAITIIQDAYRPVKTKEFVTARYTNQKGEKVEVPLDISSADSDFKFEPAVKS